MDDLIAGYRRFRAKEWPEQQKTFETLADTGQKPQILIIACVDSRIDPAMIFDAPPGEILTVRNVANLVPPYAPDITYHGTSAAVEFGVRVLEVAHIVVLGHGLCGGIQALLDHTPENAHANDFIQPWMMIAESALRLAERCAGEERQQRCEHEAIKISLANLMGFPWIAERVRAGTLELHGAWFDVRTGLLDLLQPNGMFQPVE